jgi:hypothetical protein
MENPGMVNPGMVTLLGSGGKEIWGSVGKGIWGSVGKERWGSVGKESWGSGGMQGRDKETLGSEGKGGSEILGVVMDTSNSACELKPAAETESCARTKTANASPTTNELILPAIVAYTSWSRSQMKCVHEPYEFSVLQFSVTQQTSSAIKRIEWIW